MAAAIRDNAGKVRGALSVAGPAYRLTLERLELLGPALSDAARRVGAQLNESRVRLGDPDVEMVDCPWSFNGAFPRWSVERNTLFWADILAPAIRILTKAGERIFSRLEAPVVAMELHQHGLLIAHDNGWLLCDFEGVQHPLPDWPGKTLKVLCAHPHGSIWACVTTSAGCRVGELSHHGELRNPWEFQEPITSLCWDEGGEALYATGPQSGTSYVMSPSSSHVRRLASLPKGSGRLSGLALDQHGGVWTTLRDGWSLVRFGADGSIDRMTGLPVPVPTDLTFGGEHQDTLFITSARHNVPMEMLSNAPASGHLFRLNTLERGILSNTALWSI